MVTLLIMTNGRKAYLEQTLQSIDKLQGNITRRLIHDDSGDADYQSWLKTLGYETHFTERVGFSKAVVSAWQQVDQDENSFVFHLEEDFIILDVVRLDDLMNVLIEQNLAQLVLLRQPIGHRERMKGGIIYSHPEQYEEKTDGNHFWVEHRVNFSFNPTLYHKSLLREHPWIDMPYSERRYGEMLFADPNQRCAFWGKKDDPNRVYHIGEVRTGSGY